MHTCIQHIDIQREVRGKWIPCLYQPFFYINLTQVSTSLVKATSAVKGLIRSVRSPAYRALSQLLIHVGQPSSTVFNLWVTIPFRVLEQPFHRACVIRWPTYQMTLQFKIAKLQLWR